MLERLASRAEIILDYVFTSPPQSVGTTIVDGLQEDWPRDPGFQVAELRFSRVIFDRKSRYIRHVPSDWIHPGERVEVIIRKGEPILFLRNTSHFLGLPETWIVAIRPFDAANYRNPIHRNDPVLNTIFHRNFMSEETAPLFYERFIRDRSTSPSVTRFS